MKIFSSLEIYRRIGTLAVPLLVGQISQVLIGLTDTIMLGRIGVTELAAASFTNTVQGVILVASAGSLQILASIGSRARHAENSAHSKAAAAFFIKNARRITLAVASVALFILLLLSLDVSWMQQPESVTAIFKPYYLICAVSVFAGVYSTGAKYILDGLGSARNSSLVMVFVLFLNFFLNGTFIFGWFFDLKLGLIGCGLATLISRSFGMCAMAFLLKKSLSRYNSVEHQERTLKHNQNFTVSKTKNRSEYKTENRAKDAELASAYGLKKLTKLAIPGAFMAFAEFGAFSVVGLLAGQLGESSLAANQIAIQITGTTFLAAMALSQATCILASAANRERTLFIKYLGSGYFLVLGFMSVSAALIFLFHQSLAHLFVSDLEVTAIASNILLVIAVYQIVDGGQLIGLAALRSLDDIRIPSIFVFLAYWVFALPLGIYAANDLELGVPGYWMGLSAGMLAITVFCAWRLWFMMKTLFPLEGKKARSSGSTLPRIES